MNTNVWLITGGAGSLGREILPRLAAADPRGEFVLLLRGAGPGAIEDRLAELDRYVRTYWGRSIRGRLTPLRGDVAAPRLGLAPSEYASLAARVTHVVHAAAIIHLNAPEEEARRVNVGGTWEVLRLARRAPRLRHLAHVSTAYVAGDRTGRILEGELARGQRFLNSYEASKFEAEELVRAAAPDVPVTIFRPSIIVGDATDGHTCNFATIYFPLRLIARGRVTEIPGPPDAPLDLVPVDHVARCVVELSLAPRRRGATYHLAAGPGRCVPVRELLDAARAACGARTLPPLRYADGADGCARSDAASGPGRRARPLRDHFAYLAYPKAFDTAALERDLPEELAPHPRAYLPGALDFCRATDWGARLPWGDPPCRTSLAA